MSTEPRPRSGKRIVLLAGALLGACAICSVIAYLVGGSPPTAEPAAEVAARAATQPELKCHGFVGKEEEICNYKILLTADHAYIESWSRSRSIATKRLA